MTANQKASPTIMWLKQLTTSTFSGVSKGFDRIAFVRRNKKSLAVLVVLWLLVIVGGHILFQAAAQNRMNNFLKENASAANHLADQNGALLLEDEMLTLNRNVTEFAKQQDILFAAILNHENTIVAHSDPEKFNQQFEPLAEQTHLMTMDEVEINTGKLPSGDEAVTFSRSITFSGIQIGSAVYALDANQLKGIVNRFRMYRFSLFILATFAVCGIAVFLDHRSRKPRPAPSAVSMDGSRIGPYRLREKIAQGGMAELYLADYNRDDGFRRVVAVKKVLPHLAENQDFINMFIREARLAALLQHPNVVQIFDFGKIQNAYFIAMEYIQGYTLGQIMAYLQEGLPLDMAIFVILKVSLGLDYSHKRKDDDSGKPLGIVHRDISPQNVLVSFQGEVKISDFGISKANTEPSLTQAGVIKGKLGYLSPEQALGQAVDHQADIYALGLVFYEILTATRIYNFDSDIEAIRTIPEMEIQPPSHVRPDIPAALDHIILRCLAKDKKERYADAKALHDDLMRLKQHMQIPFDASDLSNFMKTTFDHG